MAQAFQGDAFQNNAFEAGSSVVTRFASGNAQALVTNPHPCVSAQANAAIRATYSGFAQANAKIILLGNASAQASVQIKLVQTVFAQANARILKVVPQVAQSAVSIEQTYWVGAQANSYICIRTFQSAQARVWIKQTAVEGFGQANAYILNKDAFAQAATWIVGRSRAPAQALAMLASTDDGPYRKQAYALGAIAHFKLGESSGNFLNTIKTGDAVVSGSITYGVPHILRYDPDTAVKFNTQTTSLGTATISTMPTSAGSSVTVSFWMMWSGVYDTRPVGIGSVMALVFDADTGMFGFTANAGDVYGIDAASNIPVNQWVHVSAVFYAGTSDNNKLYINGIQQSLSGTTHSQALSTTLYIGGSAIADQQFAGGGLDELSVFNYGLTVQQAWDLYLSGVQPQGSGQAAAKIFAVGYPQSAQAQALVKGVPQQFAQAQVFMRTRFAWAQSQAKVKSFGNQQFGQAQAWLKFNLRPAQAQAAIIPQQGFLAYLLSGSDPTANFSNVVGTWAEAYVHGIQWAVTGGYYPYGGDLFNYAAGLPPYYFRNDSWSVRLIKWFTADQTGAWTFTALADDWWFLYIYDESNTLVGSASSNVGYNGAVINLTSGQKYRMDIQFLQGGSAWVLAARYNRPGGGRQFLFDGNPPWMPTTFPMGFGQAQADIKDSANNVSGQAQALIKMHLATAFANADIEATTVRPAQAQVYIRKSSGFAQANAQIKLGPRGYAQALTLVKGRNWPVAQAMVSIDIAKLKSAFVQAAILDFSQMFAQAQVVITPNVRVTAQTTEVLVSYTSADIRVTAQTTEVLVSYNAGLRVTAATQEVLWIPGPMKIRIAQAQAYIYSPFSWKFGQAAAFISGHAYPQGQAQAWIYITQNVFAQATFSITTREVQLIAQAQAWIAARHSGYAQAQTQLNSHIHLYYGSAIAEIKVVNNDSLAQAAAKIVYPRWPSGQAMAMVNRAQRTSFAQADIRTSYTASGQALAYINIRYSWAQSMATLAAAGVQSGQALAFILKTQQPAQALAWIKGSIRTGVASAQAKILRFDSLAPAQANADILKWSVRMGQSQADIKVTNYAVANVSWKIVYQPDCFAQAQTTIRRFKTGSAQAMALIAGQKYAQAQASIRQLYTNATAQAQAMVVSGQTYLVYFNNYLLPGYAQSESFTSAQRLINMDAPYIDGSDSFYNGLDNKLISMTFRVVQPTTALMKLDVQRASTMLHSNRADDYERLYIGNGDRYYLARVHNFKVETDAKNRFIDYTVEWTARPWEYGTVSYTISGSGSLDTGDSRSLDSGTWTPARISMTGTDITVSGYNQYGDFTGFISVSGYVSNLSVDGLTSSMGGRTADKYIDNQDYRMYVGPGRNYYVTSGVTSISISWENRW